jgi:hypothetical protein
VPATPLRKGSLEPSDLDRTSEQALYQQFYERIRGAIRVQLLTRTAGRLILPAFHLSGQTNAIWSRE